MVYFPMHLLMILTIDIVVLVNIQRQHLFAHYNHHYPSRLPSLDLNLEVILLLLQNLVVNTRIRLVVLLIHLQSGFYESLQGKII